MTFFSSRTFPGHKCPRSTASARGPNPGKTPLPNARVISTANAFARVMMSAGRARSGRDRDDLECEAIEQVGPERSGSCERRQIDVCRADDPHVQLDGPASADPFHLAVLDDSEHFFLHRRRSIRDFVEQQSPPVRAFEAAHVLALRAGKCPRFVAEELRVEQRLGESGAVHLDERTVPPRREVVQSGREQFLPGASLADDEARPVDGRESGYLLLDLQEDGVLTENVWQLSHRSSVVNFAQI